MSEDDDEDEVVIQSIGTIIQLTQDEETVEPKDPIGFVHFPERAMNNELVVNGSDVLSRINLTFKAPRVFKPRIWLASRLFHIGGWILGVNTVVEVTDNNREIAWEDPTS